MCRCGSRRALRHHAQRLPRHRKPAPGKSYRAWGSDIGPNHTPVEAGLAWACKARGNLDFQDRATIEAQLSKGVAKQLACFTADDPDAALHSRETIFRDGEQVGWLTSGGHGHTVGKAIDYIYVRHPVIDRVRG